MTKTIKLSLAAAMVAGIATTASASNLQDAIQNVDVSGYVDYRAEYQSKNDDGTKTTAKDLNEYAINVTLTSKVNDMVKATVSAGFDEALTHNNSNVGDVDPSLNVSAAYFTFDLGAATVMAGKQNIPSAFVDQKDTAKAGSGVVAVSKVNDALTVAAAHFFNNNIAGDTKTTELVAMGKAGAVSYGINYNMTDLAGTEANRYSVHAGAKVAGVKLSARYSALDADNETTNNDDVNVLKVSAAGKAGAVALSATYFKTGEDNTGTNAGQDALAIDADNDAAVHAKVWQLSTAKVSDTTGYALTAAMDVAKNVNAKLVYAAADNSDKSTDATETMAMVTYKMSKNFKVHARYSMLDDKSSSNKDTDYTRVEVKYTF